MSSKPSLAQEPGRFPSTDAPAGPAPVMRPVPDQAPETAAPGDEALPGTPGTGEDVCYDCGGTGLQNGGICPGCEGSGRIVKAIGGA